MAVVFDPHENLPGNIITGLTVPVTGTKYRMLIPSCGPFYSHSLVVKSGNTELKLGNDYLITHPYLTAMSRTGRSVHGMIWVVNPKFTDGFTVSCNALGMGIATSAQITAERTANASKYPSDCQWEQVIGDVYFPPVDIQFDWENWKGERELMQAIVEIGKKMSQIRSVPDPIAYNLGKATLNASGISNPMTAYLWKYDNAGNYEYNRTDRLYPGISFKKANGASYDDYTIDVAPTFKNRVGWPSDYMVMSLASFAGSTYLQIKAKVHLSLVLTVNVGASSYNGSFALLPDLTAEEFDNPIRVSVTRRGGNKFYDIKASTVSRSMSYTYDLDNPPAEFAGPYGRRDIPTEASKPTVVVLTTLQGPGDTLTLYNVPGMPEETISDSVYQLLVKYHALVGKLYRDTPAIPHVARKDNPHDDESYGRMRAIELNGIASDTTLAFGKTQPQLADYVNQRSAKATDFSDKMLRKNAAPRTVTGTFTMLPGLSAITSAKTKEADGVGSTIQVDDKVLRLLSRDSTTINAGNNPITFKGGANQLILYPDTRGLQWNSKQILDPTTVGPYLPGNEGGGAGVFYCSSTLQVTASGSGIQTMPFNFTYNPPDDTDVAALAFRQLTDDFGSSTSLAATPKLIQKLANAFTGKLEASKAYINGMSLMGSITLDKYSFNLDLVENLADTAMPLSNAQATELQKYATTDHTHQPSEFGIGDATTAKAGLIRFGGLVNDAGLALDGQYVIKQDTDVTALEERAANSDTESLIDIIRYGLSGNADVANAPTHTGWMVTIPSNNYFVGKDYTVPLATFNLAELYPQSHADTTLGIFVDIVNNAAVYVVKDNPDFAENDTLTRIGEIITDEDDVVDVRVRNTTRLGSFRELEDHIANVSAHAPRTMTQAQFGQTYNQAGPAWNNGLMGNQRFDGDYRMLKDSDYVVMGNIDWQGDKTMLFRAAGIAATDHRYLLKQLPYTTMSNYTLAWATDDPQAGSVFETVIAAWVDKKGVRNRLSILLQRTNNLTDANGNLCYAGLALNYQTARQSLIAFTHTAFTTAMTWTQLAPSVNFNINRMSGNLYVSGTLTLNNKATIFGVTLTGTASLEVSTTGQTNQVVDLSGRFATYGVDVTDVAKPDWDVFVGCGGLFSADARAAITQDLGTNKGTPHYETAWDFIHNMSELNRVRVVRGSGSQSTSLLGARNLAAAADLAKANRNPGGVPNYLNKDRLVLMAQGTHYTAAVIRD